MYYYSALFLSVLVTIASAAYESVPLRYSLPDPTRRTYTLGHSNIRHTRQVHGSTYVNSDKTSGMNVKIPVAGNDKNVLSAIGGLNFDAKRQLQSASAGVALDNVNGHGLSLTETRIPDFGKRLTAAGHANVFHNPNHDVTANAFISRSMPNIPDVPNFNTMGGGVDYMYKNRIGASLTAAHTPLFKRTDYSATGNLNLFRDKSTSLDFNAGFSKSVSPFMRNTGWEPSTGFTFRKFF